jgi:DNA-binding NarL/FixJ family response regulator
MEIQVVIAENQKLFRQILTSSLNSFGIRTVAEAANGAELIKILEYQKPDIVLLDIEMPVMSGDKALTYIRKTFPDLPVIVLSQYNEQELVINFLMNGASAYIDKSADIEVLSEAIFKVKECGFYFDNLSEGIKDVITKNDGSQFRQLVFSRRETEIIPMIFEGKTSKAIADELNIVVKTVEAHRKNIYRKTHSLTVTDFMKYSLTHGLSFFIRSSS